MAVYVKPARKRLLDALGPAVWVSHRVADDIHLWADSDHQEAHPGPPDADLDGCTHAPCGWTLRARRCGANCAAWLTKCLSDGRRS